MVRNTRQLVAHSDLKLQSVLEKESRRGRALRSVVNGRVKLSVERTEGRKEGGREAKGTYVSCNAFVERIGIDYFHA